MDEAIRNLQDKANRLRLQIVKMIGPGKAGHLGGSCSIADITAVLYFHHMKHDPKNPKLKDRDRFLLSKGHSALVQYAALAECGYFPEEELKNVKKLGSMLQGHPDMRKVTGIEVNTGSLGQGLSMAAGIAAAGKLDKLGYRVFCIIGDGEIAEGQIWEAAMAAAFYKLDNLVAILDKNRLQATGSIVERFNSNPLKEKWEAFGWKAFECDGHDIPAILATLKKADEVIGRPVIILADTVKGKGISFAENNAAFHNGIMTEEQYQLVLRELRERQGAEQGAGQGGSKCRING